MHLIIIRMLYVLICAGVVISIINSGGSPTTPKWVESYPIPAFIGLMLLSQIVIIIDLLIPRKRLDIISSIYFGLLIGGLLSWALMQALVPWQLEISQFSFLTRFIPLVITYGCIAVLIQTRDDFRFVIPYVEFQKEVKGGRPLLLDTSSLIDGRIADVMEAKLFDTELVVPDFILSEIQDIADSSDKMRRTRGRRGLDVLARLQQNTKIEVRMQDTAQKDFKGLTVDQRLVHLAKDIGGRVVTSDFNLNKVASVQGVDVINLNDIANALKPRYLPGEQLKIKVIREGEAPGQGVGYLDDGTMVICEQTANQVGKEIEVIVTSVLQNSAGRMIFGKLPGAVGMR